MKQFPEVTEASLTITSLELHHVNKTTTEKDRQPLHLLNKKVPNLPLHR